MTRHQIRERIEKIGIIPSIRLSSAPDAVFAAGTIAESGIPIIEVTMTVPGAVEVIGGNVDDTVSRSIFPLDANGFLSPIAGRPVFTVIENTLPWE